MERVSPEAAGFDAVRLGRIDGWMQSYVDRGRYPGASVLIARGGRAVHFASRGLRDIEAGAPMTRDTLLRIYSMTKPVTSLAIMLLVERGLFHLDAPISDFLPEFRDCRALIAGATAIDQTEPCATPTVHQLLTHTSGLSYAFNTGILPQAMDAAGIVFRPDSGPLADQVRNLAALPLAFHPGRRWEYSVAIDVLGRIIEVVSGQSLGDFFATEIFAPLGMQETGFSVPDGGLARFAALYSSLEGNPMALGSRPQTPILRRIDGQDGSPWLRATTHSGGGGLVSSIDDYMRFADMLRAGGAGAHGRIVSPATLAFMMRNHLPGDIASMGPTSFAEQPMEGMGFGLGGAVVLNPGRVRAPGSVGDFSWGGMASTFFWVDRAHDMAVVFMTQLSPSSSYPARSELKALVHGALLNGALIDGTSFA